MRTAVQGQPAADSFARERLLTVRNLSVEFETRRGTVRVLDGVSFDLGHGERLGIVGESGSGKTITTRAIIRQLPPGGDIAGGEVRWKGVDVAGLSERAVRKIRGAEIVVVPQDPMASLNPVLTIGMQVAEPLVVHRGARWKKAKAEAVRYLRRVRIPEAERRIEQHPHQFSGGMRQRALIAMGLTCDPELIIADEPTTALDMTVQAQILQVLAEEQERTGAALILVTHDLSLVAQTCDRIVVMYAGRVVEQGTVEDIFRKPVHPYTEALLSSLPVPGDKRKRLYSIAGHPPDPTNWPPGCRFAPRCPYVFDRCTDSYPRPVQVRAGHDVACWIAEERAEAEGRPARE